MSALPILASLGARFLPALAAVHWDANDVAGVHNDPVTFVPDRTGNGFDLDTPSATPPQLLVVSGMKRIGFTASPFRRILRSSVNLNSAWGLGTKGTVFAVTQATNNSGFRFMCDMPNSNNRLGLYYNFTDGKVYLDFGDAASGGRYSFSHATGGVLRVIAFVKDGAKFRMFVNGTLTQTSDTAFTDTVGIQAGATGSFVLGADAVSGGSGSGNLGEMFVLNFVPSDEEIAKTNAYLMNKWGL